MKQDQIKTWIVRDYCIGKDVGKVEAATQRSALIKAHKQYGVMFIRVYEKLNVSEGGK